MTNTNDDPSGNDNPLANEKWTVANGDQLGEVFRLLSVPQVPGYTPAGITAVGALVSRTGEIWHYPVYAQLFGASLFGVDLSESSEIRAAIAILQRALRMHHERERYDGNLFN
jgi:hypothetical protein